MKCIVTFFENAKKAISESVKTERKLSWAVIQNSLDTEYYELSQMKFQLPSNSKEFFNEYFNKLCEDIDNGFRKLIHG